MLWALNAFSVLFSCYLNNVLCSTPSHHPSLCVSAKPFVTGVKGPSSERQSPPEHGLHVLGSDCLCHGYSQQARLARHPSSSLPWSRGKSLACTPLLIPFCPASPRTAVGPTHRPNHITHHSFAQLPPSDKHTIKKSGSQDNYLWTIRAILILSLTAVSICIWLFVILLCIYVSNFLVMAGYDISWSARIFARVSVRLYYHWIVFFSGNICCFSGCFPLTPIFYLPVLSLSPSNPIPSNQQSQQPSQVRIYLI